MTSRLPYELREAVVKVCGKCFWYKDPFRDFLVGCGVPLAMYQRYSNESKFKIARHLLADLDQMKDEGYGIQRRIVTELCKLRKLPDENVPDRDAGFDALRTLKQLGVQNRLVVKKKKAEAAARAKTAEQKAARVRKRAQKVADLRDEFARLLQAADNPQARGYSLEDLLVDLFQLHEIDYRKPYRTATEQIDGHFNYRGFDYIVEARWRQEPPTAADLGAFKSKVDRRITSTRGLFVSIVGFRPEVVDEVTRGTTSNIILMDGLDLNVILDERVSLNDALEAKAQKAAQEGVIFYHVGNLW